MMEVEQIESKYLRYPTVWKIGLKEDKFIVSTRAKDLDEVFETYTFRGGEWDWRKYVAYCRKHSHILYKTATSDFHYEAFKKAKDCGEWELYEMVWLLSRSLGWAVLEGDIAKIDKIIRRMPMSRLRKAPSRVIEMLRSLPLSSTALNRIILAKVE